MCTFRASCYSTFVVGASSDLGQPFSPRQKILAFVLKEHYCSGGSRFPLLLSQWSFTICLKEGRKEGNVLFNDALNTFYLRLYGVRHMVRTILIVRKETCCHHIGYSYRLTARVLLYAPSHRQDNTYVCSICL